MEGKKCKKKGKNPLLEMTFFKNVKTIVKGKARERYQLDSVVMV